MAEKTKVKKTKQSISFEENQAKSDKLGEIEDLRQELAQLKGKLKPQSQKPVLDDEDDDDDEVQKIKAEPPIVYAKPKKERSQKQMEQFQKAVEARKASIAKRAEMRKEAEGKAQKILEEKILKKAIRVKKKQIKQLQMFEPTESEEESEEEEVVEPKARPKPETKPKPSPIQTKPKYSFV
jgi:hypothetical protein